MPVLRCSNKKYKIGSGKCIYSSKAKAESAYRGYLGTKYGKLLKGGIDMDPKLNFFARISKLDPDQRMVYGIATCSKLDNQNEIVDYAATKEAVADYSNWRNIREMHKPSAVGTAPVLELRDNTQELFIGAKIVDDAAWQKCKEGVYKGFSIGGDKLDQKIEMDKASGKTVNRITKYNLNEISLVDRPANPACKFQTVKRDTSVHTVTISEDPLKAEAARVMEKSLLFAKRVLSKEELEALPDTAFGLIKVTVDGDTLIKQRSYPMPDRTHAINMIRKSIGDPISDIDKARVHDTALLVLGKKHIEGECPYCIEQKLKGGAVVADKVKKAGSVVITHEPDKKTVEVKDEGAADAKDIKPAADALKDKPAAEKAPEAVGTKPAEEQKPHIEAEEEEAPADVATTSDQKLDRIIALLESALGEEEGEEQPAAEETGYEEEVPAEVEEAIEGEKPVAGEEVPVEGEAPKIKVEDEDEEPAKADVKPAEEEETVKGTKAGAVKKIKKGLFLKQIKAVIEPMKKELTELRAKVAKYEKQPLARKDAAAVNKDGTPVKAVKVEKYQDVKLEKKESTFSEELTKDIEKAQNLRMTKGAGLTKEENDFCLRVADRMIAEKLSK
jgi:hypothetical protein